jgi:hypothetical protein
MQGAIMSDSDATVTTDAASGSDDDWTPQRRYRPGTADQILVSQRAREAQEREKSEANRPTGTEIGQITAKLKALTAQLAEQQKQLKTAQDQLAKQQTQLQDQQNALATQQTEMVRRTPQPEGRTQHTGSAQATTGTNTLHTYVIAIPSGKNKAFISLSATASTTDSGATPFLEIYEDGTLVSLMTIPNILPANGLSFSQTVTENHSYTVRVATGTGSALVRNITSWFTVIYYV